jgi:aldehyde:ferredoxin oxidoreductase
MERNQAKAFPYRERAILLVDVGQESWQRIPLEEKEAKKFLGGRLLALRLWDKYAEYGNMESSAYESGNPVVIAPGSAADASLSPCDTCTFVTRSPLVGRLSVSCCEGPFAQAVLGCGYSAIVIVGRFRRLSALEIDSRSVLFPNAEKFHDMENSRLASEFPLRHLVALGPAGEHQVPYSSIWCDGANVGRGGVGMVFGLKNIKYIALAPSVAAREAYDPKQVGKAMQGQQALAAKSKVSRAVAENGSVALVGRANAHGWAAVDTFSLRTDGRLWGLDPACSSPPAGKDFPSCSTALALGANLELFDFGNVLALEERCADLGLDCLSAGAVLAWARKTRKEGTLPFLPDLERATARQYMHILDAMAYRKGSGEQLSETIDTLVTRFGGAANAYAVSDIPLAPYDLRALPSQALLAALGDDTLVFPDLLFGNRYRRGKEDRMASWAVLSQDVRYAMESLGLRYRTVLPFFEHCPVSRPWKPFRDRLFSWLCVWVSATEGYPVSGTQVAEYGKAAWDLQRSIDRALLAGALPVSLPDQVLVNGRSNHRSQAVVPLARLVDAYVWLRGIKEY